MKTLQPSGWRRPRGYSNGISATGRLIVTGGVVGWDEEEQFTSDRLSDQFAQALRNIMGILACDGADASRIVRLTCYVTSIDEYLESAKEIGAVWREIMGKHYPAMALVEVVRLVEREAKVEIEATAVVPE